MRESLGRARHHEDLAEDEEQVEKQDPSLAYYYGADDPAQKLRVAQNRLEELRKELSEIDQDYALLMARRDATKHINERVALADEFKSIKDRKDDATDSLELWTHLEELAEGLTEANKKHLH